MIKTTTENYSIQIYSFCQKNVSKEWPMFLIKYLTYKGQNNFQKRCGFFWITRFCVSIFFVLIRIFNQRQNFRRIRSGPIQSVTFQPMKKIQVGI